MVCYWFLQIEAGHIDPHICTHIIYSFIGLDYNGGLNWLDQSDWQGESKRFPIHRKLLFNEILFPDQLRSLTSLRSQNPNLKVLVAIGGYHEPLIPIWSSVAANPELRINFARNILNFLQRFDLNGVGELDLDLKTEI